MALNKKSKEGKVKAQQITYYIKKICWNMSKYSQAKIVARDIEELDGEQKKDNTETKELLYL